MRPRSGARVVLDLEDAGPAEVVYRAAIYAPDAEWRGVARVAPDGAIRFDDWDAPPALVEQARAFLRVEWRARQGADPPPWPARINRWRG